MAQRRMFAKTIIDSDAFLDMPISAQLLYFHLAMRADDDGFLNNPKRIQRMIGASDDDLKVLIAKHFLIVFESGVVVIKHWRIHNYIQSDRHKDTVYQEELAMLEIKENKAYTLNASIMDTKCVQNAYSLETQVRLGKDRLGEDKTDTRARARGVVFDESMIPPSWSDSMKHTIRDWFDYKIERKEYYKERGWKSLISSVDFAIKEHGEEAVIRQITDSMGNNYKGMGLERITSKRQQTRVNGINRSFERKAPDNFDDLLKIRKEGG